MIKEASDTHLSGTINAATSGLMFTSIPYDEGWSVYIDGVKTDTTKICKDALTGVYVTAGNHTIEFKYMPKGFVPGIIITILCILILVGLIFHKQILSFITNKKNGNTKESKEPENQE